GTGRYGGFMRTGRRALRALVQSPFLEYARDGPSFSIRYRPDLDWHAAGGSVESDRGLLVPYLLTGRRLPAQMTPEWRLASTSPAAADGADEAEIEAYTDCVRAFLLYRPTRPLNVLAGWCVN